MVDVIVGVALMLILFLALFGVLRASLTLSAITKAKAVAVELASTQIEYMRGLSYGSLGTVGGIPSGTIPQVATSTVDGIPYIIRTFVEYKDDPTDGLGAADANAITTDYKVGRVTISYSIHGLVKSTTLLSNFVPLTIESSTGGGTLSIHAVDAAGTNVSGASVRIFNTATVPAIDFVTFTNIGGFAIIGGAATSTEYQILVSKAGYSSAQTYARVGQNVNPMPGYLTVVKDQTTGATFSIDLLASLSISSFSPAVTTAFSDLFSSDIHLASQTNTVVTGNELVLTTEELSGSARSTTITPSALDGWGILSATLSTPSGTSALVRVVDASGVPLDDSVLMGNGAGFSSFPVSLTNLSTTTYPALALEISLARNATTTTVALQNWSLSHTEGPFILPNVAFTLTGTKSIGTDASNKPIAKTILSDTTGAAATKTESLEWDAYTLSLDSMDLIESCPADPLSIAPASVTGVSLVVGALTDHTLPIIIETAAGNVIPNAKVVLAKSDYAATVPTSVCGLAYFGELTSGDYSATVSAPGYVTKTFSDISVAGHMATTTLILP
jgi:hypothetical protein